MKKVMMLLMALCLALAMIACAESAEAPETEPETEAVQPAGFVLVTTATQSGWLALPTDEDTVFPLTQIRADGSTVENVIHLTPNGVYVEDASCENHDCVDQGEVTLENREERILGNMIICLPNQVVIQLYTPEETLALLGAVPEQEAENEE